MKLSVITINYNNAEGLRKTITSVLSQTYTDFEYIIVDGASTDNSVAVIKELLNSNTQPNVRWISEPDNGIYNAMNKGITMARGEYLQFLNSGDWLVDEYVYQKVFATNASVDIIYGNRIQCYSDGSTLLNKNYHKSEFLFREVYQGCVFHTCAFCKYDLFEKYGVFDESFKIVSDYGFFLKTIGLHDVSVQYIDVTISNFDMTGISQSSDYRVLQDKEIIEIREKILPRGIIRDYDQFLFYNRVFTKLKSKRWSWFLFRVLLKLTR